MTMFPPDEIWCGLIWTIFCCERTGLFGCTMVVELVFIGYDARVIVIAGAELLAAMPLKAPVPLLVGIIWFAEGGIPPWGFKMTWCPWIVTMVGYEGDCWIWPEGDETLVADDFNTVPAIVALMAVPLLNCGMTVVPCCKRFCGVGVSGKRTRMLELLRMGIWETFGLRFGKGLTELGDCNWIVAGWAIGRICRSNCPVGWANMVFPFPVLTTCIGWKKMNIEIVGAIT